MTVEALIMIIDGPEARAEDLKELIEFMDAPSVRIANCGNWRKRLGDRRLAAVFVGDDLDRPQVDQLIREVGEFDPNTPIVKVSASGKLAGAQEDGG